MNKEGANDNLSRRHPGNKFDNYGDAGIITRDYVCAHCFGRLIIHELDETTPAGRHFLAVQCINCGPGTGFVTEQYAERKKSESIAELSEAKKNLAEAMGLETKKITFEEKLKMLGFGK